MSIRPITDTLRLIDGGVFVDIASDKLSELVKSVDETGKSGTLTIKLELKRAREGALNITPTVVAKLPEKKADPSLLWVTVEGNLSQENPNQQRLDLRPVETKPTEIREAPNAPTTDLRQA